MQQKKRDIQKADSDKRAQWLEKLAIEATIHDPNKEWQQILDQMIAAAKQKGVQRKLTSIFKPERSSLSDIEIPTDQWYYDSKSDELYVDPSQLDRDHFTINTQSGPVSLTGGQAEKLSSERLFTKTTSASWQGDAECPSFLKFIRSVFNDDEELIEWVQRAIGYSLSARVTEQVLFIAYGTGANGKSTLFELLHMI